MAWGLPSHEQVESALEAEALGLEEVLATGAEGRTAVKVGRPLASPGVSGRRLPRFPGLFGVDLVQCRELRFHCYTSVILRLSFKGTCRLRFAGCAKSRR